MKEETMKLHSQCDCRNLNGCPKSIPMGLLNEDWAQANHGQTLKRLNERGGLSLEEALAIIQKRRFYKMQPEKAVTIYLHILTGYEIALEKQDFQRMNPTQSNEKHYDGGMDV